ncbi:MAG: hypothetical protein K6T81_14325 [Alicyclobacillus macrosporangiidus]|nr:hypothetical protein [Alicyclobacillus macrosporangiidus]
MGQPVYQLQNIFNRNWAIAKPSRSIKHVKTFGKSNTSDAPSIPSSRLNVPWNTAMGSTQAGRNKSEWYEAYVQTVENRPDNPARNVHHLSFFCHTLAMRSLNITTPYFIPSPDLVSALKAASIRGIRVRLLLPRHNNKIVRYASQAYYEELLKSGVEIYLYDKGVLHAKVLTVDEEVSVLGTANFDLRSFLLDYEVCEVVYSREVARQLTDQFERDLSESILLNLEDFRERPRWERVLEQGALLLAPLL